MRLSLTSGERDLLRERLEEEISNLTDDIGTYESKNQYEEMSDAESDRQSARDLLVSIGRPYKGTQTITIDSQERDYLLDVFDLGDSLGSETEYAVLAKLGSTAYRRSPLFNSRKLQRIRKGRGWWGERKRHSEVARRGR